MRKLAVTVVSSLLVALPHLARAESDVGSGVDPFLKAAPRGPPENGLSIGLRGAYGLPFGARSGAQGDNLSGTLTRSFPLQIDLGWRFSPNLYAGIYFQGAIASLAPGLTEGCGTDGVTCSASDLRLGVDLVYTFLPRTRFAPWIGIGGGYENAKVRVPHAGQAVDISYKGYELPDLMAGVDFRLASALRIGPFVTLTLARFTSVETPVDPDTDQIGSTQSFGIARKAVHGWLQLGLKGTLDL